MIATSMKYSPLDPDQKKLILDVIEKELVTPRGLRTLSPKNPQYVGIYSGDQEERDSAYHQGTVWPWLLEHYVRGYLEIHKNSGLPLVEKLYAGFQEVISEYGIGSIGEIFDGDPPHNPVGTISQAWSVAALLQISNMIDEAKAKQLNNTR
jgi:glycogen debranching enzyme